MPTLCHKNQIPYAIVHSKSELGKIVHMKTCACVAFTDVRPEDKLSLDRLRQAVAVEVDYARASKTYGGSGHAHEAADAPAE